jgi:hypothetical protein
METLKISVGDEQVSGLLLRPASAKALYLFAHGAGAGMTHKAMESNAQCLAERGIATLRYQFLYMEKGSKRPDAPKLAHAVVRAAAAEALRLAPDLPLFAGGRSYGGRMTSQAQADAPLPAVKGLAAGNRAGRASCACRRANAVRFGGSRCSGRPRSTEAGRRWSRRPGDFAPRQSCRSQLQGRGEERPDVGRRGGGSAGRAHQLDLSLNCRWPGQLASMNKGLIPQTGLLLSRCPTHPT